ncbi:kinase domain protein [Ceratobasidium sp. AG-Ba]|nr:kinase domain protein [Ceratobasidium sp. AG-Ba]
MSALPTQSFDTAELATHAPEKRLEVEERWVSFQPYLQSKGYQLRPRYRPGWVPSWIKTGANPLECEDSPHVLPLRTLDATRVNDKLQVFIKMIVPSDMDHEGRQELEILQRFSAPPFSDDPTNHVVPLLDTFPIPEVEGGVFVVMPLLSKYKNPPFYNLSEIHDFLTQLFEGLEFLHLNDVAHCDIAPANVMMDKSPLFDEPFHPFHNHLSLDGQRTISPKYTRSQHPVRYYYIDFGYGKWFKDPTMPRTSVGMQAKERAPEQADGVVYDPFKVDIYQLGAIIRRDLIPRYKLLGVLLPLARDMTNSDPRKRPNLQVAQITLHTHFAGLPGWRTRWPLIAPDASFQQRIRLVISGLAAELFVFLKQLLSLVRSQS